MTGLPQSHLAKLLINGDFVVTAEIGPPVGPNPDSLRKKARELKGKADAFNVTDNQTAVVRMSSIAASRILLDEGLEPIMQMTCRDRNRIAIQSDLLGAWALGIRNCLCISGDHQKASAAGKLKGNAGSKKVFDVDSIQLVSIMNKLRSDAIQDSGDPISEPLPFLIGAAWTPLGPPKEFRVFRLAKKIIAGSDFIQTQAVFDVPQLSKQIQEARKKGLTDKTAILAGIIVPRSAGMLSYMNDSVPGVVVPDELISRMKSSDDPKREGINITVELIKEVRQIPGIQGVHLQAIEAEHLLPEIIEKAGLLPRPPNV